MALATEVTSSTRVLDLCCGNGGKTLALASMMADDCVYAEGSEKGGSGEPKGNVEVACGPTGKIYAYVNGSNTNTITVTDATPPHRATRPEVPSRSFWPTFGGHFEGWEMKRQSSSMHEWTPWRL